MTAFAPLAAAALVIASVCTLGAQAAPTPAAITVTSPAFKHGQPLPVDYTADGKNISPPLMWTGAPVGTKELVLIHEDPSAPTPQPFVHWVVYKIPATAKGLPENISADPAVAMPAALTGAVQGISGFRRAGYRGPAPPKPGKVHHYHFIVYALDAPLDVQPGLNKKQLLAAMKGHIIGQGEIVGTYERQPPQ
ncbi:MAG TPA: YbhB/YbcL family Raf kinase inhibitor-like protein [Vicinamibacterales bacterium]|nr:YbhB/YbcL family Raf kinase inhibitor-like protein [Vicinamibacterales bacterium]